MKKYNKSSNKQIHENFGLEVLCNCLTYRSPKNLIVQQNLGWLDLKDIEGDKRIERGKQSKNLKNKKTKSKRLGRFDLKLIMIKQNGTTTNLVNNKSTNSDNN